MSAKVKGWSSAVLTALIVLPIFYVLSFGPVAYAIAHDIRIDPRLRSILDALYTPFSILWLRTPLSDPLDAYIKWWMELGGP
ncbi:MAG: hypothetical protein ACO1QR_13970 [Chthoniobacteraceae bacterium]